MVLLRVHRGHQDLLVVVGQPRRHVGQLEEDGVPYDVEERRGNEPRLLPDHLAEAAPPAVAPVLQGVVVILADGDLLEAVPLYPAALVGAPELRPYLRREPIQEVEQRRGIPAHHGPGEAEGLAAGLREGAGGDALGRAASLVLVDLVSDQQVEEALHPVLHV